MLDSVYSDRMRDLKDAVLWRGTPSDAKAEARKLTATARRLGYQVVVRSTRRRYGNHVIKGSPYGVFLEPWNATSSSDS